ncbi:MAG: response regulator, partial [Planctomycetota bacterium]
MDIVIVEDDGLSRQLLTHLLHRWQHQVVAFSDGDAAFQHLLQAKDMQLAILDWMLPGMEGIDICRRLREAGKHHYLMMLTFRHQRTDCITALQAGADDFVPKPFHPDELHARLTVAERILRLENDLAVQNECLQRHSVHLESLVEQRAREMMHADRMASIGQLSAGIAHELNNPLAYVSGNVQILERVFQRMMPCISDCQRCVDWTSEIPDILHGIR